MGEAEASACSVRNDWVGVARSAAHLLKRAATGSGGAEAPREAAALKGGATGNSRFLATVGMKTYGEKRRHIRYAQCKRAAALQN